LRLALSSTSEFTSQSQAINVIVLGSISGRVDQGIGLLGEFYRETQRSPDNMRLWLVSGSGVSWLLPPGDNTLLGLDIKPSDSKEAIFTPNVGILPIYGPSVITTIGLEWDVTDWETKMGENVSTSNHVIGDKVSIKTTEWVLFTVELAIEAN
jgi:thiamine pyrophosphokinase